MIKKKILLEVMIENHKEVMRHTVIPRIFNLDGFDCQVLVGVSKGANLISCMGRFRYSSLQDTAGTR